MPHYQLRDYEMNLLGELQRQQNSAQFCDTLLQTEGISVPTHSCVLAAFSPYFSQKLSATPSPPNGQKRQIQVQSLKAHTLLKLVGLLYSGELEVKGSVEHSDVMNAVQKFGITPLIQRQRNEATKEMDPQENRVRSYSKCCTLTAAGGESAKCKTMKDSLGDPKMAGIGKDTHRSVEKTNCVSNGTQTLLENLSEPVTSEHIKCHLQNIPLDTCESSSHEPSASVTNPTSNDQVSSNRSCSSNNDMSFSQKPWNESTGSTGSTLLLTQTKDKIKTSRVEAEKIPEVENGNSTERRPVFAKIAKKNLPKMKLMESTQLSVKVKLRRRSSKEKLWEVVSIPDDDERTSGFTPLPQEASPAAAQTSIHKQGEPSNSNRLPSHPSTTSERSHHVIDCTAPHQSGTLQSASVPQPHGLSEESDEQIEKLLEDIMMGLNILTDLGSPEGDTGQSKILSATPSAECQNVVERSDRISTYTAQKQPNCKSEPLVDPSSMEIPEQPFNLDLSSVRSLEQNYQPVQEAHPLSSFSSPCLNDLRLPRCLSPIDPFTSAEIDNLTANNYQLPRCVEPLLIEHSGLLVFPMAHREDEQPPLLKTRQNCWRKPFLKQLESEPQQSQSCRTLPCMRNAVGACPTAAERKSYPMKIKPTLIRKKSVALDGIAPPKKRKVCVDYPPDAIGSNCDAYLSTKQLSVCSVSLSRNNVLAKERNMAKGSPKSPTVLSVTQNQLSTTKNHVKERTITVEPPKSTNTSQTRIKTRDFLKTTQGPPSDTCTQSTNANAKVPRFPIASNQVCLFKPKRGRRPKNTKALFSPNTSAPVISKSENEVKIEEELFKIDLEKSNIMKRKGPKNKKGRGKEQVVTMSAAKTDNDASKQKIAFSKRHNLKKKSVSQEVGKKRHNLKKKSVSQEVGKKSFNGDDHIESVRIPLQEETSANVNVSVDVNHCQILKQSPDEKDRLQEQDSESSFRKRTTFLTAEHPSWDEAKESFTQHSERDQAQKTPIQGLTPVVMPPQKNNPGCSLSDRHPCPQNQASLEPTVNPQISTCLSAVTGSPVNPECNKEDIIEVDDILSSPEKILLISQHECILVDADTTPSEEEGEIDVTGDELD
ncbi:uncharacterized protein ACBT44_009378 isoform 1-T2 [Syngnathus typhle]